MDPHGRKNDGVARQGQQRSEDGDENERKAKDRERIDNNSETPADDQDGEHQGQTSAATDVVKDTDQQNSESVVKNPDKDDEVAAGRSRGQAPSVVSPNDSSSLRKRATAAAATTTTRQLVQPGLACYVDVRSISTSPDDGELYVDGDGLLSSASEDHHHQQQQEHESQATNSTTAEDDQEPHNYVLVIVEPTRGESSTQLLALASATATPVYLFDKWRDWNRTLVVFAVVTATAVATLTWTIIFSL